MRKHLIVGVLMAAVLCIGFSIAAFAATEQNEIVSIRLNKSKTDLVFEIALSEEYVKAHPTGELALFELLPHQTAAQLDELEPVKILDVKEKLSVKLSYINGNVNRLYSAFVVAEKQEDGSYLAVTNAKYVQNAELLAENTEAYPTKSSKKGLQIQMFEDAQQLGVQHTVINVPINEYMLGENTEAAISFVYNGQTFYLDKNKISVLDHRVKTYTEAGINNYFNLILTAPDENTHENIRAFYYEGISSEAALFALNTESETAMKNFRAFIDYLCARYTRSDHLYGFAPNLILGFEVNSNRVWNNAGSLEIEEYVSSYARAFRTAYLAMASHYSEGRVYLSLGNNFNAASSDLLTTADSMQDYPAKRFLELFHDEIQASGDIPWGLSVNPYASDPSMTDYWNDTMAENNENTPFLTMKNIDVLTSFLSAEEFLYDGEVRSIIVGEFGVSGDPDSESSMTLQAAAYALAYYTVAQNEDIDAFIYHRHVDHAGEAQYYGLWSNELGAIVEPNAKKTIYNVFLKIDTDTGEEATAFVKQTVGNGMWGLYMSDKIKYKNFIARTSFSGLAADASDFEKGYETELLYDLTKGKLYDFYPSDNVEYVELRPAEDSENTMLYAKLTGIPTSYRGISKKFEEKSMLRNAYYLTLRMMVSAPEETEAMSVMLRLQENGGEGENAVVYEGETQIIPNQWQEISFRIRDFSAKTNGEADLLKLWVRTIDSSAADGEYGIWLESVTVVTKNGLSVLGLILLILLGILLAAVAVYGVLYVRAYVIRAQRRKQREAELARRRREQLRIQAMQQTRGMNPPYGRQKEHQTQSFPRYRGDDY